MPLHHLTGRDLARMRSLLEQRPPGAEHESGEDSLKTPGRAVGNGRV